MQLCLNNTQSHLISICVRQTLLWCCQMYLIRPPLTQPEALGQTHLQAYINAAIHTHTSADTSTYTRGPESGTWLLGAAVWSRGHLGAGSLGAGVWAPVWYENLSGVVSCPENSNINIDGLDSVTIGSRDQWRQIAWMQWIISKCRSMLFWWK